MYINLDKEHSFDDLLNYDEMQKKSHSEKEHISLWRKKKYNPRYVPSGAYQFTKNYMSFLDELCDMLKSRTSTKYMWVATHLYCAIWYKLLRSSCDYDDTNKITLVRKFVKMFDCDKLPISTLTTNMRTTKQLHDFKNEMEWQTFCNIANYQKCLFISRKMHLRVIQATQF